MTARDGLPHAPMLALDDPSWTRLQCAHGSARGIPALLAQLDGAGEAGLQDEPWQSLWTAICDGGDVYPAAFAAVPHIVAILAEAPERATPSHFALPARIELARAAQDAEIPDYLIDGYVTALARLPLLAGLVATPAWNGRMCNAALAATAAATGQHAVAELLLESDDLCAVLAGLQDA